MKDAVHSVNSRFIGFSWSTSAALTRISPTAAHLGDGPDAETLLGSMIRPFMEIPMKTSKLVCINTVSLVATGLLAWGSAAPAAAADSPDTVHTKQVRLSDLDLSTAAGQASAHERLLQMARRLCTEVEDLDDLSHHANFLKCVDAATAGTLAHLDAMIRSETQIRTASVAQIQR